MAFNRYSLDLEASSSQYAYVADNAALSLTSTISFEAWIKLEQLPSTVGAAMAIMAKDDVASQRSYHFRLLSDNKLAISFLDNSGNETSATSNSAIVSASDVGKWIHVAGTISAASKTFTMYKMGESIANTVTGTATSIKDGTASFNIGILSDNTNNKFDGMINNARIWSDIRSQAEIQANMYKVITGTSDNLVGSWYNYDNDHNDNGGTNHLTTVNTPTISTNVPWTGANTTDWTRVDKRIDHTKVSGSADLTNFPVLIKDGNLSDAMYAGLQCEINGTPFKALSSLRAYYRHESGALLTDSSPNGYTLTNLNTVAEGTGKFGGGADFSNANTNKSLYVSSNLGRTTTTSPYTISLRVKLSAEIGSGTWTFADLITGVSGNQADNAIDYEYNGGTRRIAFKRIGSSTQAVYFNLTMGTSNWYTLTMVSNGSTIYGYVNGKLVGSVSISGNGINSDVFFSIGSVKSYGQFASCIIDDVAVFDTNFTDREVQRLAQGASDLRITTDSAGTTEIPYEIVSMDTTAKTCEIWAKIPTVSYTADTPIYLWYGNANALAYDANAPFGSQAVWSGHKAVYHLESLTADSTSNAYTLTNNNSVINGTGKIGNGADFGSSNTTKYLNIANSLGINNYQAGVLAVESWVNISTAPDTDTFQMLWGITVLTKQQMNFNYQDNSGVKKFSLNFWNGSAFTEYQWNQTLTPGTLYHIVVVKNGTTLTVYVNGSSLGNLTHSSTDASPSRADNFTIGRNSYDSNGFLKAIEDNVMVMVTAPTADWIATEYANQNDPSTFLVDGLITALFSESVSASDSMTRTTAKTFAEAVSAADSVLRSITKGFVETVTASPLYNASIGRLMSESVVATDSVVRATGKTFSESFTVSDAFSSYLVIFKSFTESISISDTVNRSITKVFSEAVSAVEAMARTVSKQWSETVATSDSLVNTIGMIMIETVTVSVSMVLVIAKAFVESIGVAVSLGTLVTVNFVESISSSISFNIAVAVSFMESLHIADTLTRWKNGIKILWEFFYTPRGTSYTNKHSSRGTTWTKKY